MKTAAVLFNLGGPDSPQAVKPFLINLFSDPAGSLPIASRTEYSWTPTTPFFLNAAQVSPGKRLAADIANAVFFKNVLREWLMIVRFK